MATPHVAGAAALLVERHPTWTVPQIKSALTQTGDPARTTANSEALSVREGGGIVDLPRADAPLLFATPSSLSFGSPAPGRNQDTRRLAGGCGRRGRRLEQRCPGPERRRAGVRPGRRDRSRRLAAHRDRGQDRG